VYATWVIAALIIGGATAWYLGIRAGVIAAVMSAALLLVAMFVPPTSLGIYIVLGAYCVGLYFFGSKLPGLSQKKSAPLGGWKTQAGKWAIKAKSLWK
jgi:CHASE2 domain-containing sensor protein